MKRFFVVWAILAVMFLAASIPVQAQVSDESEDGVRTYDLEVTKEFTEKYPIAAPDFQPISSGGGGPAAISQGLPKRLMNTLDLTGGFIPLDKRSYLESDVRAGIDQDRLIKFEEWGILNAKYLVKGGFRVEGSALTLELRLYDVFERKLMIGKRYNGSVKDGRKMINRFSNEILYAITGEYGVFGTEMVFVTGGKANKRVFKTEFGGDEAVQVSSGSGPQFMPAISDSGAAAYVTREGYKYQLKLGSRVISAGELHLSPAFTPGGEILAAVSGPSATNIFRFSPGGGKPRPVTNTSGINISPTVSPDGGRVAFVSDRAGGPQIYVKSISGGSAMRLTSIKGENTDPSWSPRGDRIAFCNNGRDIYTIAPDGSDLMQLTGGMGANTHPSWSPDGRLIVFASSRLGKRQLFIMTANGDRQQPMMPDFPGNQYDPSWSRKKPEGAK